MSAAPDLLITQDLCQVCGPSGNEVAEVLKTLEPKPLVLWQTPKTYDEVFAALLELGRKTGREKEALAILNGAMQRLEAVKSKGGGRKKVRVSFLEWVDPVYSAGHWLPAMLGWAGGEDANAKGGIDSLRLDWADVLKWNPEVLIVAPCGFETEKAHAQAQKLSANSGWGGIAAVKNGRVFAVDANAYFARPGPRLIDGVELLAHLVDPGVAWRGPAAAYRKVA